MKVTGERFIPKHMSLDAEIEHFHRYFAAQTLVQGKNILDAACGTGYGSKILAEKATHVYGLDLSPEAVEYAKANYNGENITYQVGSIAELPFADGLFDVVVSFETIEHVDQTIQKLFLQEIKRVLKPDGLLIMSTPNKKTFTDDRGLITKFHIKEFYESEFIDFLKKEFSTVQIYNQYFAKTSQMLSYTTEHVQTLNYDKSRKGFFFIALASNSQLIDSAAFETIYYYPDEYLRRDGLLQIYYQKDGRFNEEWKENIQIDSKPGAVSESIEFSEVRTQSLRIDPLESACNIRVENIAVYLSDGTLITNLPFTNNADIIDGDHLIFLHNDPQLLINFDSEKDILSVTVQFTVFPFDRDLLYHHYAKIKNEKEKEWGQSLKTEKDKNAALQSLLEESREKETTLDHVLQDERKKSELLQSLLNESREKESTLNNVLEDERKKSELLQSLLNESREKEGMLNNVLQGEREKSALLESSLQEEQKKNAEFGSMLEELKATILNLRTEQENERTLWGEKEGKMKRLLERIKQPKLWCIYRKIFGIHDDEV